MLFFPLQSVYLFHFSFSSCLFLPPSLTLILCLGSITLSHLIPSPIPPLSRLSVYYPDRYLFPPPPFFPTVISSFFILQLSSPLTLHPSFLFSYRLLSSVSFDSSFASILSAPSVIHLSIFFLFFVIAPFFKPCLHLFLCSIFFLFYGLQCGLLFVCTSATCSISREIW